MQLKFEELIRRLSGGKVDHLYLFTAGESYFLKQAVNLVRRECLGQEERENFHSLSCEDLDFDSLLALIQTLPLVGRQRLILLSGLEKIKSRDAELMLRLLLKKYPSPPPARLILVAEGLDGQRRLDEFFKTKLGGFLKKEAVAVHFYRLFENEVPGWIVRKVKESGKAISPTLAQVIAEMLGNDPSQIESELEKVYLYMGREKQISQQHLSVICGQARIFSIFELVERVAEGNVEFSLKILDKLMEEGESHLVILAMISRQFRQIYRAKALLRQGVRQADLARTLGIAPLFARKIAEQATFFSFEGLQALFIKFFETDLALKSSGCQPRLILEKLIIDICGQNHLWCFDELSLGESKGR